MERWVEETLHRGFRVNLKADRVLFDSETEHQRLIIFDNADFGRVMMLDSIVQVTTKDEFIYHEMMSHVPLFAHGRAKRALIVAAATAASCARRSSTRSSKRSRCARSIAASSTCAANIFRRSPAPTTFPAPGSSSPTARNSWLRPTTGST